MAGIGDSSLTQPPLPPPAGECPGSTTTIHSLGDDLLLAIFLRLPSLPALIRAALTCRGWRRAVASSPAFRRRFRALHPAPPLLGFFFQAPPPAQEPNVPAFPSFAPARSHDRDMAAAVRGGDFFLTALQCRPDDLCWDMVDCCRGYCLLMNWDECLFVVLNPLKRRGGEFAFTMGSADIFEGYRGKSHPVELNVRLLCASEGLASFCVVILALDDTRVRANVYSSDSGEWSVLPWVRVPAPVRSEDDQCNFWLENDGGLQADGFLFWVYADRRYLLSLDTATMEFSVAHLPRAASNCRFNIGETENGAPCIVYSHELNIGVLVHMRDGGGRERWVQHRAVHMGGELKRVLRAGSRDGSRVLMSLVDDPSLLFVLAVQDGYAYLTTAPILHDPRHPCWFLSLCLETMKLERLFRGTLDNDVHPYIMAWPSSLLGNYGRFALEDAL